MSQPKDELRALADAMYGALNAGDLDAFLALATEDVEFTSMVAEVEGTTFRSDDLGVVHFHIAGSLGGVPVEQTMWQAVESRDGKVRWWGLFRNELEALEAVGLRE